jgi:protein phosphatase
MTPLEGDLLVLCTDGLTTHVGDSEIARMITEEPNLDLAARALVQAANDAGGLDNITVVLIRCEAED